MVAKISGFAGAGTLAAAVFTWAMTTTETLRNDAERQRAEIAALRDEMADLRRFARIGPRFTEGDGQRLSARVALLEARVAALHQ